jgi:hypothetical protein
MNENINRFKNRKAFNTPDDYFENFALKMQNSILEKEEINWFQKTFSFSMLKLAIPSFAALIICLSIYFINKSNKIEQLIISSQNITNYIIDESDFTLMDDYEQLLAFNLDLNQASLSENEIIDYLIEEEIELELLTQ